MSIQGGSIQIGKDDKARYHLLRDGLHLSFIPGGYRQARHAADTAAKSLGLVVDGAIVKLDSGAMPEAWSQSVMDAAEVSLALPGTPGTSVPFKRTPLPLATVVPEAVVSRSEFGTPMERVPTPPFTGPGAVLLALSVKDIAETLTSVGNAMYDGHLSAMLAAEQSGKNRKGAIAAIRARMAAVGAKA